MALRYYTERLDRQAVTRTAAGMVRVDATVAKAGVYKYTRADGSVIREYLPPEEVAKADSLASLDDVTVTNRHPGNMVDPSTWKDVAIGHTRNPRADGGKALATLVIARADAQAGIGKDLIEVSRGVRVRVDNTPGVTPEGEHYDAVQRDIVYNHIALGPQGWGRQGSEVALRLDSAGDELPPACCADCAARRDAHLPWDECMVKAMKEYGNEETAKKVCGSIKAANDSKENNMLKYDGKEFKTDAELAAYIDGLRTDAFPPKKGADDEEGPPSSAPGKKATKKDADDALAAEKARADAAQAKLDARDAQDKAAARATLDTQARAVLGADVKFDGKADREVHLAVLAKLAPAMKFDGKEDVYVKSAYDFCLTSAPASSNRSDAMAAGLHGVTAGGFGAAPRTDDKGEPTDPRERMIRRDAEAWKIKQA